MLGRLEGSSFVALLRRHCFPLGGTKRKRRQCKIECRTHAEPSLARSPAQVALRLLRARPPPTTTGAGPGAAQMNFSSFFPPLLLLPLPLLLLLPLLLCRRSHSSNKLRAFAARRTSATARPISNQRTCTSGAARLQPAERFRLSLAKPAAAKLDWAEFGGAELESIWPAFAPNNITLSLVKILFRSSKIIDTNFCKTRKTIPPPRRPADFGATFLETLSPTVNQTSLGPAGGSRASVAAFQLRIISRAQFISRNSEPPLWRPPLSTCRRGPAFLPPVQLPILSCLFLMK